MKLVRAAATAAAILAFAPVLPAANGITLTMKTTSGGDTRTQTMQMDANHIRVDIADAGKNQIMIFDGAKQVLDIVDLDAKTYTEMTKEDVDRISQQLSGVMAQMQSAMANMPPEQRARIEAMMKGRMGGAGAAAAAKPVYKKVGTDTVGKWTCDKYERYEDNKKTADICTVEPSAIGLSTGDFTVLKQMGDFFSAMLKFAPQGQSEARQLFTLGTPQAEGFSGFPIKTTHDVMGRTTTMELENVTRGTVPDSAFQVPAGLQKKSLPIPNGRGRR